MDKYEIKELIGDYLEGIISLDSLDGLIQAVLLGPVETSQGLQRYYVDIDTLLLDNIDTSEAIWSLGEDETYKGKESEIVFFEELNYLRGVRKRILSQEDGIAKWQRIELKVLNRIGELHG
ncbi:hypothetical protein [Microbulbifer sp. JTAC008]|uniref:hypothetical protein n=1 Tax=unclassified Microbulbifer TaxID=2619833 RepID=UPI00403A5E71